MSYKRHGPSTALLLLACCALAAQATDGPRDVSPLLSPILEKHGIPGMVVMTVEGERVVAAGAAGFRRAGGPEHVTLDDKFHLGSCTKSMTATLCAILVEEGKLKWTTTIGEAFPRLRETMRPEYGDVTLEQLLTHRGGVPTDLTFDGLWGKLWNFGGPPDAARQLLLEGVVAHEPQAAPGTQYIYSNGGFAIAGHMAERAAGMPWEQLVSARLFRPLGITSAGFGAPGNLKDVDQPRGHTALGIAVPPTVLADNPAAIAPAGRAHMAIGDWAKYVSLHLCENRLLRPESFRKLHAPADGPGERYAMGWLVTPRPWGGGDVLTHAGSNTMWFCVTWLAPKRKFAVLVCCNRGGDEAAKGCDEAAWQLIQDYQRHAADK